MATARLIDSQRQELVQRFRQGESTQALAEHFGCSPTTVTRMVRAELGDEAYAALREERQKKSGRDRPLATAAPSTQLEIVPEDVPEAEGEPPLPTAADSGVLAIDDAEDFGDEDEGDEDLLLAEDEGDDDGNQESGDFYAVAVLPIAVDDQQETKAAPWSPAHLPSCAYLLVDKTVELQARPLGEMPELGRLAREELDRQALVLFTNPRQAKRLCGRTQRVIKLPDPALLGRTAPYLQAQGISRVVIEGALYALPE